MAASSIPGVSPRMLHSLLVSHFEQPILPNGRKRRPLMVESPPGYGKTEIIYQAAEAVRLPLCELRLIQHESVEVTGAIGIDQVTKTADWYPFTTMFPTDPDWQGVLFLEEIGLLDTSLQKAVMGIIDRGGVAGRRIPQGARFVLAGNRQQDRAGSSRLLTPIENRTLGVELLFSLTEWEAWAASSGIDQVVRSYGDFVGTGVLGVPGFIPDFNPADRIHATPRTWAAVSDELQARPTADPSDNNPEIRTVLQALVGPGHVASFMAFRQHFHLLHNVVEKVFQAPDSVPLDGLETSAQHALIGAVACRIKERNGSLTKDQAENVAIFLERLPNKCMQTIACLHCDRSGSQQWKASAGRKAWIANNAELITSAMKGLAS